MKRFFKVLTNHTLRPLVARYLKTTRVYRHNGIRLIIPPEVFHPGFFFSTRILLKYLLQQELAQLHILELGAGSGLIALSCAAKGAIVTASDINPVAVAQLEENTRGNHLSLKVILSDLFRDIPQQQFDLIAINPPYFKKDPVTVADYAWFCGENGSYFTHLFRDLGKYLHPGSKVLMILSDECDLEQISAQAKVSGFEMTPVHTQKVMWEVNCIYSISSNGLA